MMESARNEAISLEGRPCLIVPTEVTVEIENSPGSRTRNRSAAGRSNTVSKIRVAVTYWLGGSEAPQTGEETPNQVSVVPDEEHLTTVLRQAVRSTRRAYRLARAPRQRMSGTTVDVDSVQEFAPAPVQEDEVTAEVGTASADEGEKVLSEAAQTEAVSPELGRPQTECKQSEWEQCQPVLQRPEAEEAKPKPKSSSDAQRRTIEIMARQLDLKGQPLTDLLGLRCNRKRIEDLTHREAASLIAYLSRLLRQRLKKEKEEERQTRSIK